METVDWPTFYKYWKSIFSTGQHVTIIGPTGSGKSWLARELVKPADKVIGLGTKRKDKTLQDLIDNEGWHRVPNYRMIPRSAQYALVWPKGWNLETVRAEQGEVFRKTLAYCFKIGDVTIWADELRYLSNSLGLKSMIVDILTLGRSNGVGMVSCSQRPRHVPLEAYGNAQHLLLFKTTDTQDLKRIGEFNGISSGKIVDTVDSLDRHSFLHVNLITGNMVISKV